jgi:hypothetical protein
MKASLSLRILLGHLWALLSVLICTAQSADRTQPRVQADPLRVQALAARPAGFPQPLTRRRRARFYRKAAELRGDRSAAAFVARVKSADPRNGTPEYLLHDQTAAGLPAASGYRYSETSAGRHDAYGSYRFSYRPGVAAYRVDEVERVILPASRNGPRPLLISMGFTSCTGLVIRGRNPDGERVYLLGHIHVTDRVGALARIRQDIQHLWGRGWRDLEVVTSIDGDSEERPAHRKWAEAFYTFPADLQAALGPVAVVRAVHRTSRDQYGAPGLRHLYVTDLGVLFEFPREDEDGSGFAYFDWQKGWSAATDPLRGRPEWPPLALPAAPKDIASHAQTRRAA